VESLFLIAFAIAFATLAFFLQKRIFRDIEVKQLWDQLTPWVECHMILQYQPLAAVGSAAVRPRRDYGETGPLTLLLKLRHGC
jgi:hypothetical protein